MANFNSVTLVGNLTRDPELRYTPGGAAVCEFSIAINRSWVSKDGGKKEDVTYVDCVAWAKTAENAAKYLTKGRSVLVDGRLTQDRWETPDGQKRSKLKVTINQIQFLGGPRGESRDEAPQGVADDGDVPF